MTAPATDAQDILRSALARSATRHVRLCPRQVLGARMGLHARERPEYAVEVPLLVIVETDGCFIDGVEAATGCSPGARTLAIEDVGKVAATFVNLDTGIAARIAPRPDVRRVALEFAPDAQSRFQAQLLGYQRMPAPLLLDVRPVELRTPLVDLRGRRGRTACLRCGEEVIDGREVTAGRTTLCRPCAWGGYYRPAAGPSR